jgi:hypothetical protein
MKSLHPNFMQQAFAMNFSMLTTINNKILMDGGDKFSIL